MSIACQIELSPLALDVLTGLAKKGQKKLPPKYFYDALGSKLFEAITLLPEYGLSRADSRVLQSAAGEVAQLLGPNSLIAELGSGSGSKTTHILRAARSSGLKYYPIDVSAQALNACSQELQDLATVQTIEADYLDGLAKISQFRGANGHLLLLFLGSSIGNFEATERAEFLRRIHASLRPGDLFLLGLDLVKNVDQMLMAYDDPTGVTAAFNLNVLARINRELQANFDLKTFEHLATWNACDSRIEMHLVSKMRQRVDFPTLDANATFEAGETIWTESSHKFHLEELRAHALDSGFQLVKTWTDCEWPFSETLWRA